MRLVVEERRFALYFVALGALVFLGYGESVLGPLLAGLSAATAKAAFTAILTLGLPVTLNDTIIAHPSGFACEIYFRCTGVLPIVCLTVAIWASPGPVPRKLTGIALGVPVLLALNLLRVVHVFLIGVDRPELFGFVHGIVWEAIVVLAVIGIWWAWLRFRFCVVFKSRPEQGSTGLRRTFFDNPVPGEQEENHEAKQRR